MGAPENWQREALKNQECNHCGLPHWSVARGDGVCLSCRYFDLCREEKASVAEATEWLREKGLCAYCGEYGNEIEHVVPRWTTLPTYTLLACRECNLIASGRLFASFNDKRSYIQAKLKNKYARVLRMPEWTRDELDEMGYVLRVEIEAWERARKSLRRRVEWSWVMAYWESMH